MNDEKVELSYASLWKSIIRPPRDEYYEHQLGRYYSYIGENVFMYKGKTYYRRDFDVLNKQGNTIKASFIEPDDDSRV